MSARPFPSTELIFVVALPSEARPLVDAFGLKADEAARGVRLFRGDGVRLAVAGIGKTAAAVAVGYLAVEAPESAAWLNVGIAGHGRAPVGEAVMAHAVRDAASGQTWYPPLVLEPPAATSTVTTVDRPELSYAEDTAYEMEAAAFVAAARRFAAAELVHVLKVISDGPGVSVETLDRRRVGELVTGALPAVRGLVEGLAPLAGELARRAEPSPLEAELLERWHFTVSDRRALSRELRRLEVLGGELPEDLWQDVGRGRDAVKRLRQHLDSEALGGRALGGKILGGPALAEKGERR